MKLNEKAEKHKNKEDNKKIGNWGEEIAANFLKRKGWSILGRNYLKKWGEIDIIAKKESIIHFVEVKTVSYETREELDRTVARGTYRPEERVDGFKLKKLSRAINSWLLEYKAEEDWQIDVVSVRIVPREKYATAKLLDNVIL